MRSYPAPLFAELPFEEQTCQALSRSLGGWLQVGVPIAIALDFEKGVSAPFRDSRLKFLIRQDEEFIAWLTAQELGFDTFFGIHAAAMLLVTDDTFSDLGHVASMRFERMSVLVTAAGALFLAGDEQISKSVSPEECVALALAPAGSAHDALKRSREIEYLLEFATSILQRCKSQDQVPQLSLPHVKNAR